MTVEESVMEVDFDAADVSVGVTLRSQMIVSLTITFWQRQPVYVWVGVEYG